MTLKLPLHVYYMYYATLQTPSKMRYVQCSTDRDLMFTYSTKGLWQDGITSSVDTNDLHGMRLF